MVRFQRMLIRCYAAVIVGAGCALATLFLLAMAWFADWRPLSPDYSLVAGSICMVIYIALGLRRRNSVPTPNELELAEGGVTILAAACAILTIARSSWAVKAILIGIAIVLVMTFGLVLRSQRVQEAADCSWDEP